MFAVSDEQYEALIRDEFTQQVAAGRIPDHSVVDTIRVVQNEEVQYVGYRDLQRMQEQAMLYIAQRRVPPAEYMLPVLATAGLITPFG